MTSPSSDEPRNRRGNAAGRVRREQILEQAVGLFAANGFGATSFREIAAACGLTPAGLAHHFPTKEALLLALVEEREQHQSTALQFDGLEWARWVRAVDEDNRANRPLTQLYAILSAEAIEPTHPAHEYFVARYRRLRERMAWFLSKQRGGRRVAAVDRTNAQVLIALWDGLQLQAMLDPDLDTKAAFERAITFVQESST